MPFGWGTFPALSVFSSERIQLSIPNSGLRNGRVFLALILAKLRLSVPEPWLKILGERSRCLEALLIKGQSKKKLLPEYPHELNVDISKTEPLIVVGVAYQGAALTTQGFQ